MKTVLALLLSTLPLAAQVSFMPSLLGTWEPRNLVTKAGLCADWNPGQSTTVTLNGSGISQITDRSWVSGRLENLLLQSEAFSTTWSRTQINAFGATDTGGAGAGSFANTARTTDPLGGNTADFIQEDGTAGVQHALTQASVTYVAGATYVFSIYAKKDARYGLSIQLPSAAFTSAQIGKFDVNAGTAAIRNGTPVVAITSAGGGWYVCSITAICTTSASSTVVVFLSSDDGSTITYNGDNTSGLFLWGAQLRRSTSSSTYQSTTTVAVDASRALSQGTAANQPLISRTDNSGNLCLQSDAWSQAIWSKVRVNAFGVTDTGAAGAGSFANTTRTLDPLGGNTADFVQEDASGATTHYLSQAFTSAAGAYAISVSVKQAGRTWVRLMAEGVSGSIRCYYDVANGVLGTPGNFGTGSGAAGAISAQANGFYLCTLTGTLGTAETHYLEIYHAEADNDVTFDGDNTSGLYLWGASIRPSTWNTNYIATTTLPIYAGLGGYSVAYFDGSAYYMKTAAFTLNQPEELHLLCNQQAWVIYSTLLDGFDINSGRVRQETASPTISLNTAAGYGIAPNGNLAIGTWGVCRFILNGAASSITIAGTSPTTGTISALYNMGGFSIGARSDASFPSKMLVARCLICNKTNAPAEASYLRWGLGKQASIW